MKFVFFFLILAPGAAFAHELALYPIAGLRPTQAAVGYASVAEKARKLKKFSKDELRDYLKKHPVPVVIGPGNLPYLIDHHHLSRALADLGVPFVFVRVVANWSAMPPAVFWQNMQRSAYTYLIDPQNKPLLPSALPVSVRDLVDDPYRSLAYFARENGAYEKCAIPFAEFQWAVYYRRFITPMDLQRNPWNQTIQFALRVSMRPEARGLPGYRGPGADGKACARPDDESL